MVLKPCKETVTHPHIQTYCNTSKKSWADSFCCPVHSTQCTLYKCGIKEKAGLQDIYTGVDKYDWVSASLAQSAGLHACSTQPPCLPTPLPYPDVWRTPCLDLHAYLPGSLTLSACLACLNYNACLALSECHACLCSPPLLRACHPCLPTYFALPPCLPSFLALLAWLP